MKFNLKTLVAAVALAGASMSAMAGIQAGTAGGELVFFAYDDSAGVKASYIKDLGVSFASFLSAPSFSAPGSANISSDGNWTTYLGLVGNNLSNTKWGVFGTVELANPNVANGAKLLTTAAGNPVSISQQNGQISSATGAFNAGYLGDLADATPAGTNNSYVFDATVVTQKNWANTMKDNFNSNLTFSTANAIGTAANFYQLVRSSNRGSTVVASTPIALNPTGAQWNFDGSTVAVSAVPEPETYAMLLAGLAIVGGIARRRRRV